MRIASALLQQRYQRQLQRAEEALTEARYQHAWFQSKMRQNPGAFMVERKDGQIIIHAKTRAPRVGR